MTDAERALREALEAIAAQDELLEANEGAFNIHAARRMQAIARTTLARTTDASCEECAASPEGPWRVEAWLNENWFRVHRGTLAAAYLNSEREALAVRDALNRCSRNDT